jgi:hypothetical protein
MRTGLLGILVVTAPAFGRGTLLTRCAGGSYLATHSTRSVATAPRLRR